MAIWVPDSLLSHFIVWITVSPFGPSSDLRHFKMLALLSLHISPARAGPSIFFISPPVISQMFLSPSKGPQPWDNRAADVPIAAAKLRKYSLIYAFLVI